MMTEEAASDRSPSKISHSSVSEAISTDLLLQMQVVCPKCQARAGRVQISVVGTVGSGSYHCTSCMDPQIHAVLTVAEIAFYMEMFKNQFFDPKINTSEEKVKRRSSELVDTYGLNLEKIRPNDTVSSRSHSRNTSVGSVFDFSFDGSSPMHFFTLPTDESKVAVVAETPTPPVETVSPAEATGVRPLHISTALSDVIGHAIPEAALSPTSRGKYLKMIRKTQICDGCGNKQEAMVFAKNPSDEILDVGPMPSYFKCNYCVKRNEFHLPAKLFLANKPETDDSGSPRPPSPSRKKGLHRRVRSESAALHLHLEVPALDSPSKGSMFKKLKDRMSPRHGGPREDAMTFSSQKETRDAATGLLDEEPSFLDDGDFNHKNIF